MTYKLDYAEEAVRVRHAKDGVDFMTVHCGVTQQIVRRIAKHHRLMGIVSRGGTFLIGAKVAQLVMKKLLGKEITKIVLLKF